MKNHFLCEMRIFTLTIGHAQSDGLTELLIIVVAFFFFASIVVTPILAYRGYRRNKLWLRVLAFPFAILHLGVGIFGVMDVLWWMSVLMILAFVSLFFIFKKSPTVVQNI
ncbi:MAG: hypothetical protein ACOYLH_06895 [Flavobacteriales bacterium]